MTVTVAVTVTAVGQLELALEQLTSVLKMSFYMPNGTEPQVTYTAVAVA